MRFGEMASGCYMMHVLVAGDHQEDGDGARAAGVDEHHDGEQLVVEQVGGGAAADGAAHARQRGDRAAPRREEQPRDRPRGHEAPAQTLAGGVQYVSSYLNAPSLAFSTVQADCHLTSITR